MKMLLRGKWPRRVVFLVLILVLVGLTTWVVKSQLTTDDKTVNNPVAQDFKKRLPELKKRASDEPDNAAAHSDYAVALYATGDIETAKREYEKAVDLNKNNATTYNNLGNAYRDLGDIDKAVQSYERAIAINKTLVNAYFNLANVQQYSKKNVDDAIKTYQLGLKALPDNEQLMLALGLAYEAKNDTTSAKQIYQSILTKNPDNTAAKANLDRINK